jgi:hypothetical protein
MKAEGFRDRTSPCTFLKKLGNTMPRNSRFGITSTIFPRTFPTTISLHIQRQNTTQRQMGIEKHKGGQEEGSYGVPLW